MTFLCIQRKDLGDMGVIKQSQCTQKSLHPILFSILCSVPHYMPSLKREALSRLGILCFPGL